MINAVTNTQNTTTATKTTYSHALDAQAYSGNDLGVTYTKDHTTFKVWAPTATNVAVKLYATGSSEEEGAQSLGIRQMSKGTNGVWSVTMTGDMKNKYYTYAVTVGGVTRETVDIYAKAVGVNGNRGMIVDLDSTDPVGWQNDRHIVYDEPTDAVVWEIHIKDFSSSEASGVSVKYRGKYLAFTETGTTLNSEGEISTCVDYLKKMGVTHVQFLPVYDYATVDETKMDSDEFNWGYDPKNYNVPEGSYSTNPYDGNTRITEFKKMIMALHNAGIGVIMDVVYNHTFTAEGGWFEATVPGYYYRMNSDGTFSDGSGCGNETASDHIMYRKFMIDSVMYWANEYHIDGFRFDLMGVHDITTMNEIRKSLDTIPIYGKKIIMYGEPWTGGSLGTTIPTSVKDNVNQLDSRIGVFNDTFRDAVKGHVFNASETGFVQDGSSKNELEGGIIANCVEGRAVWANSPSQIVTYMSAHDNYTLYDKLLISTKDDRNFGERDNRLVDMNKLAAAITLTSQGISFMQAGEEFARTKFGDENSYISPIKTNQLNWNSLIEYSDLQSYYSGLIEIRKNFKPFRDSTTKSANLIKFSDNTPDGVIAYTLENTLTPDKQWAQAAVIFNANQEEKEVTLQANIGKTLPKQWTVIANKNSAGLKSLGTINGNTVTVPGGSALILVDKISFDKLKLSSDKCEVTVQYKDTKSGDIISTRVLKGTEGSGYVTSKDTSLDIQYDFNSIEGNEKGKFLKESQTVTYYYDKFDGAIATLTVNYLKQGNKEFGTSDTSVEESIIQKVREGTEYTAVIKQVAGMELDTALFPSNAIGKVSTNDITVNYYYKSKENSDLVIHYYNKDWDKVGAYIYQLNDDTRKNINSLPGEEMKPDPKLGEGWYTATIADIGNYHNLYVRFTDMSSKYDKGTDGSDYCVENEVWIKDGTTSYTGTVNVIYVRSNGVVLDTLSLSGREGTEYKTEEKEFDDMVLSASTSNIKGTYTSKPIYVIYSYSEVGIMERPNMKAIIVLTASGTAMLIAAGVLAIIYKKRKAR